MHCLQSRDFFELSVGPQPEGFLSARLFCLKDFFKRVVRFPFALLAKAVCTVKHFLGIGFSLFFLLLTLGSSRKVRERFVEKFSLFAKDLADWVLLPLALISWFIRLLLSVLIHPNFYFNAL